MSVRFELGHADSRPRGRSHILSIAGHALVGGMLIVSPALTPAALPEARVPDPGPLLPPPPSVLLSPPPQSRPAGPPSAAPPRAPAARPVRHTDPPMLPAVPSEPLANLAGRLLGSADVAADGIDWGDAQDGSPGPMPGGSPDGLPGGTAQGSSNAPREIGGELLPPVRLFAPPPRYPDLARQVRLEGEVSIECVIDHRGSVEGARVVSGPALLHQAALEAVTRWRYAPTRLNGEPVPVRLVVTVRFELR